MGTKICSV